MAVVCTWSAEVASANGPSGSGHSHASGSYRSFTSYGRSYTFHSYSHDYRSWSHYCWFPRYSCYGYYCPTQCCWYYYSGQTNCYVPVSYISTFTPVQQNLNANTNTNTNVNTNVNVIGGGAPAGPLPQAVALPPGATQLASGVVPPQPPAK
jgi:hypothetical protein